MTTPKNISSRFSILLIMLAGCIGLTAASTMLSPVPSATNSEPWPPGDSIRLCAIRVQFQPDLITGTTGNGLFNDGFPDTLLIDPLPHDRSYFEDHLAFLRNYYSTASKGAVSFSKLDVYPPYDSGAYELAHPMWHYNYNTDQSLLNQRLIELFVEAVQSASADVDYADYDAVVVFHAGVGKDFNFGFDATPFDIPSAYISQQELQSFAGQVPPGITRGGLILPEGENQKEALDFGIELSLNGIFIKLFGNWLGLPDLFDTQTGQSGVGRWGMMDQGSGNLGALVPALPDAWSRVYMGWQNVVVSPPHPLRDSVRVQVARFSVVGAPEVVKLPITPREYYLVENRDADADSILSVELRDRSGRTMRVAADGQVVSRDSTFQVAVSASKYDFGIPGSGLLIWHVDEDVIQAGLATNTVNINPEHRGVDLMEADGAQDIGQDYGFASAGSGTELGVPEDAWYQGNDANRAANGNSRTVRFRDDTRPSARLYDGSYTYYELTDFSPVDSVMSFRLFSTPVAPGFPVVFEHPAQWAEARLDADTLVAVYFLSGDSLYRADAVHGLSGLATFPVGATLSKLATRDVNGDGSEDLLIEGSRIGVIESDSGVVQVRISDAQFPSPVRVYPARSVEGAPMLLCVETDALPLPPRHLAVKLFSWDLVLLDSMEFANSQELNPIPVNIESLPATRFVLLGAGEARMVRATNAGLDFLWQLSDPRIGPSGTSVSHTSEPARHELYLDGYGYVRPDDDSLLCAYPNCIAPVVDWDGDGVPDGGGLNGASSVPREDAPSVSADTVWTIDLNVDHVPDLFGFSGSVEPNGNKRYTRVEAVKHIGGPYRGFPMAMAGVEPRMPFSRGTLNDLYTVSEVVENGLYYYTLIELPIGTTPGTRFPYQEENSMISVGPANPQVFVRDAWLYCWPNPTSDISHIRVTVPYPAQASIKVFDLAGRMVAELNGSSSIAGPFEILWNVQNIESGVYVGKVKLTGASDKTSEVKIAVVK